MTNIKIISVLSSKKIHTIQRANRFSHKIMAKLCTLLEFLLLLLQARTRALEYISLCFLFLRKNCSNCIMPSVCESKLSCHVILNMNICIYACAQELTRTEKKHVVLGTNTNCIWRVWKLETFQTDMPKMKIKTQANTHTQFPGLRAKCYLKQINKQR